MIPLLVRGRGEDHEEEDAAWDAEHVRFPLMHPAFPVSLSLSLSIPVSSSSSSPILRSFVHRIGRFDPSF